tara:strand:- start:1358 stop:2254 length:897 start_codon:yes stop_codon:yes gene_type:complete
MNDTTATPKVEAPSIGSSAMLVELQVSQWTGRKKDKTASVEVTDQNWAEKGTASVNKKLLGNCDELTAIHKFTANARNTHYKSTMPWSDTGMRLLPTESYFKYHQQMTELQNEFEGMAQSFISNYDWEISRAQARLGNLFVRDDYPTTESISRKFAFNISYIPLPDAGDFRVDVGNDQKQVLEDHYNEYYNRQLHSAMNDVWQRTYKVLSNMSERLDYAKGDTKKIFRDTLVDNVTDIVELLNVCNVTNDRQMTAMAMKLEDTLRGITPDALREDAFLRAETKRAVDKVIATLPSLEM